MSDNPNPRHPFPEKIGHLVFVEAITPDNGRYRCTYQGCNTEITRLRTSMIKAKNAASESSCKKCMRKIRKRANAAFNAGLSERNQNRMRWEILKWAVGAVVALAWIGWTEVSNG